jgi:predicted nucleotidyltransferase
LDCRSPAGAGGHAWEWKSRDFRHGFFLKGRFANPDFHGRGVRIVFVNSFISGYNLITMGKVQGKMKEKQSALLTQKEARARIRDLCREFDVASLAIFGSFSTGNSTRGSDVDILVKFRKGTHKTLFDLMDLEDRLKKVFKRKVDLVTVEGLSPFLKKDILKNSRIIYAERPGVY